MTKRERNEWLINIENTASCIAGKIGEETVDFVIGKYGVSCIENISSFALPKIFSELYTIEADLRSD